MSFGLPLGHLGVREGQIILRLKGLGHSLIYDDAVTKMFTEEISDLVRPGHPTWGVLRDSDAADHHERNDHVITHPTDSYEFLRLHKS